MLLIGNFYCLNSFMYRNLVLDLPYIPHFYFKESEMKSVFGSFLVGCKLGNYHYPFNQLFVTKDCKLMCVCEVGKLASCSPLCPKKPSMNCTGKQGIVIRYEVRSFEPKCFCERETCIHDFKG